MRLLLDTTYFLPTIGIGIKNIPKRALGELLRRNYDIFMSEISIFELSAKGAKYVAEGKIPPERVLRGIRAILYEDKVVKIPIHEGRSLLTSFKLRRMLPDFIDCIILSSAMVNCQVLITEDEDIHRLKEDKGFNELLTVIKPDFKILRLAEIL